MRRITEILLLLAAFCASAGAQEIPVDGYAAIVNDRVITVGDVLSFIQPVHEQLRMSYDGSELELKLQEAFDSGRDALIEKALILEEFESREGVMPDRAVDEHISNIIQERFDSDRAAFLEVLGRERITLEEWREQIKEQLIVTILRRQMISARVIVPPKAIHDLYKERADRYRVPAKLKLRMIVLNLGETEAEMAVKRDEAQGLVAKLRGGADFAETAIASSEGQKAAEGGDWGWMEPRTLRSELAEAARGLKTGEVSDAVEAGDSLYILMVEGRQEEGVKPLEEVKETLEKELRRAEEQKLYTSWIERLKEKYFVKIF